MDKNIKIKKIVRKIYNIDYSKITLQADQEFIQESTGVSEFTQMLKKVDMSNGIIVTPSGYRSGLFYSIDNDGEIYSSSSLLPDLVTFGMNILGLKKNMFYRITVVGRNTDNNTLITDDRSLTIIDDTHQVVMQEDFKGYNKNNAVYGIFRAYSNEANLFFTMGKIIIKDLIIEEVLLDEEEKLNADPEEHTEEVVDGREALALYGVFTLAPNIPPGFKGRYVPLTKIMGKGLSMSYDQFDKKYVLEKSNEDVIIDDPFTNLDYRVEFNFNKVINNNEFDRYAVTNVSMNISPNTLKQGFIEFSLYKNNNKIKHENPNSRLYVGIYKLF